MIIVLAYHSISDLNYPYAISPTIFRQQMLILKKYTHVISLAELDELCKRKIMPKEPITAITFDDGIMDNFTNAYPILKELGLPGTVFMATSLIGKQHPHPSLPHVFPMLTMEAIQELEKEGLLMVEPHTHTHPDLRALTDGQVADEFKLAQELLEKSSGRPKRFTAYPKGLFDQRIKQISNQFHALSFGPAGVIETWEKVDSAALPRITLRQDISLLKFRLLVMPLFWKIRLAFQRLWSA